MMAVESDRKMSELRDALEEVLEYWTSPRTKEWPSGLTEEEMSVKRLALAAQALLGER